MATKKQAKRAPAKKTAITAKKSAAKKASASTTKKAVKKPVKQAKVAKQKAPAKAAKKVAAKVTKKPAAKKAAKKPAAKKASGRVARKAPAKQTSSKPSAPAVRRLEYTSGASGKFWEAEVNGSSLVLRWGKLGTSGQTRTKDFRDADAAQAELDKVAASKLKKGYVDAQGTKAPAKTATTSVAKPPTKKAPTRKALGRTPATTTKGPSTATLKYVTTVARGDIEVVGTKQNSKGEFEIFDVGCTLEEHENLTASYVDGVLFAAFALEDDEVVFRFPRPSDPAALDGVEKFYRPLKTPANWLEYRRPLSRDPRPDLQARFSMIGTSQREFLQRLKQSTPKGPSVDQLVFEYADNAPAAATVGLKSICSNGGPYLALPVSALAQWGGYDDTSEYEKIDCAGPPEGELTSVAGVKGLVLTTPDLLYWLPNDEGGLLVRSVHLDAADEDLLREMVEGLPGKFWKSLGRPLTIQEDWVVFDAAIEGESAESEGIVLNLAPGHYQIAHRKYHDETTLLYVTRLQRK